MPVPKEAMFSPPRPLPSDVAQHASNVRQVATHLNDDSPTYPTWRMMSNQDGVYQIGSTDPPDETSDPITVEDDVYLLRIRKYHDWTDIVGEVRGQLRVSAGDLFTMYLCVRPWNDTSTATFRFQQITRWSGVVGEAIMNGISDGVSGLPAGIYDCFLYILLDGSTEVQHRVPRTTLQFYVREQPRFLSSGESWS